jgi:hypothetical protein
MKNGKLIGRIFGIGLVLVLIVMMLGVLPALVGKVEASLVTEIRDWYDLDAVRSNLGGSYILTCNLDSTTAGYTELASPSANEGHGWQPIAYFTGGFDGQGYEIRDLSIDRSGEDYVGLFGSVGTPGVIKNIGVVNTVVAGHYYVGALAGNKSGIVSNCYATGSVTGDYYVGGLAGQTDGTPGVITMSNCYFIGSVIGNWMVGGLVGNTYGSMLSNSYSDGTVAGRDQVGGLIGNLEGWGVTKCYSRASVTGVFGVGGLAGSIAGPCVTDCYATGNVTGGDNVGGLVGYLRLGGGTGKHLSSSNVGGLLGQNYEGTVDNCFWDTQTSGQSTSAAGTGKTTLEMKDITTLKDAGWDIKMTTLGNPTGGYPFLSWQLSGSSIWLITEEIPAGCVATTTDTGIACFTTSRGTIEDLEALPAIPPSAPAGIVFPHGMFSFRVTGLSSGQQVTITIDLPQAAPIGTRWWKYQSGSWHSLPIGDDDGDNIITITLQDGVSPGDADLIAGQITDPGGPGYPGSVGWDTYPINKVRVMLPWIALGAVIMGGASLLVVRRRRAQN